VSNAGVSVYVYTQCPDGRSCSITPDGPVCDNLDCSAQVFNTNNKAFLDNSTPTRPIVNSFPIEQPGPVMSVPDNGLDRQAVASQPTVDPNLTPVQ
jgi:hypothetical protein